MLNHLKKLLNSNAKVFLLLISLGFIVYFNSLGNQMFWDDQDNILFNEYVHNWHYFTRYFTENNVAGRGLISNYWRPLPLTIWSFEWHLWQDWAGGYHFVQVGLHVGAAILLFVLLTKLFKNRLVSLLTSILFLVHPLQTEAITYVSGISDPLSAVFLFGGLLLYIRWRASDKLPHQSVTFYLSLVAFVLSLLSRETTVFFLGYFVLAEFILRPPNKDCSWKKFLLTLVHNLWPYALCTIFYVLLRATALNFQNTFNLYNEQNQFTSHISIRIFTFFRIISIYLGLLSWPFNLHMERSVKLATSLWNFDVLFGLSVIISFLSASIFFLKKAPIVSFSVLWILIGLFPTSNILVPINGLIFEHWLYVPMVGFWLLVSWIGVKLAHKHKLLVLPLVTSYLLLVTFFSVRTIQQNRVWNNPIRFYNYTLKFAPQSYRVLNNLGMAYADQDDHANAIHTYQLAISENPSNAVAYHNLANSYKALGDTQKAIESYEKAIELQPDFYYSYNALAQLYYDEKNYQNAVNILQRLYNQNHDTSLLQLIEQLKTLK